jgi:AraC-like DNA-binding protein
VERDRGWDYCAFYPSAALLERIAEDVLGGHGGLDLGRDFLRCDPAIAGDLLRANAVIAASPDAMERQCAAYEAFGAVIGRYGERTRRCRRPAPSNARLREAVDFLEAHHAQAITVSEVAAAAGLSDYHFMRTFRAGTGLSVHGYLTQIRLRHAKALLMGGMSAAETASSVGFFDQSHLIRQFRSHLGVTPGAFVTASR